MFASIQSNLPLILSKQCLNKAMKTIIRDEFNPSIIIEELLDGAGVIMLKGVFTQERIKRIRQKLETATDQAIDTGSHFNKNDQDPLLQRRLWFTSLVELDPDIAALVEEPMIFQAMQAFLGKEFVMGSMCASRIMPGYGGQQPHIDYPYWDFYRNETFPTRTNSSFPLNAQAIILIDEFTKENGATALAPGSQKDLCYPDKNSDFFGRCIRLTGAPGDVVLFFGAAWHCAMPNQSKTGRIGILVEFLPKFVTPIEDLTTDLDKNYLRDSSPEMQQLLGMKYPWPSTPPHHPLQ
jgi:ectoine hydroxylase-related dioxygenase (phytanoyl-CoA dioxygenase family)